MELIWRAPGESLFVDKRFSGVFKTACVTCHNPGFGFGGGRFFSKSFDGGAPDLPYSEPVVFFLAGLFHVGWQMNLSAQVLIQRLSEETEEVWPNERISKSTIGKSILAFERSLIPGFSRFGR